MYHLPQCPSFSCGWTSDCIQVPTGVCASHDETSSLNSNERGYTGDVQEPDWYVPDPSTPSPFAFANGSRYVVLARLREPSVSPLLPSDSPLIVPVEKSTVWQLTGYGWSASADDAPTSAMTATPADRTSFMETPFP